MRYAHYFHNHKFDGKANPVLSIFQVWLSFTKRDTYDMIIKFSVVIAGFIIFTPTDRDTETLPMYKVTNQLVWDPRNDIHDENK